MVKQIPEARFSKTHEILRKVVPGGLGKEIRVFRSVDNIGRDSIDSISNDGFFTYEWFKALETQHSFAISPIYIAVYDEGKLAAFAPCFLDLLGEYFYYGPRVRYTLNCLKKILNLGQRFGLCQNHVLICYSPFCDRSKILRGKNSEDKRLLSLLSDTINEICKRQRILFSSFLFVSEFDRHMIESLENLGYLKSPGVTTLYLDVQWSNFDDYLKSLKSKTRQNIKREIKKCRESGFTIQKREFKDISAKLSELVSNNQEKYSKNSTCIFGPSFFSKLSEQAKDKTIVFIAEKDNEIMGFSLSLRQGNVLDVFMVGFDYDLQTKTDFTYFNLAYYAPIKFAIEEGIQKIYYRRKAEKVKLDRGCEPEKTYSFVKCHNDFLRALINKAAKNPPYSYLKRWLVMKPL